MYLFFRSVQKTNPNQLKKMVIFSKKYITYITMVVRPWFLRPWLSRSIPSWPVLIPFDPITVTFFIIVQTNKNNKVCNPKRTLEVNFRGQKRFIARQSKIVTRPLCNIHCDIWSHIRQVKNRKAKLNNTIVRIAPGCECNSGGESLNLSKGCW